MRNRYERENYDFSDEEDNNFDDNFRRREGSISENPKFQLESGFRASPVPEPTSFRHRTPAPPLIKAPPTKSNANSWIVIVTVVIVAALSAFYYNSPKTTVIKSKSDCSLFADLQNSFPDQDHKLFKSLRVGVEGMMKGEPMVVSLFSTDSSVIKDVMQGVIRATKKCINQSQDPLSLTSQQLGPKMVADYKEELSKRSIMIINNVEEASPMSVSSLHSFCDTYNPLVSNSIIFITIKVPAKPQGKPVEYITDFLHQHWKSLPDHVRSPLITRMLDQTFFLKP
jgi:hypothetical protein